MSNPRNPKNWCISCGKYCRGSQSSLCRDCFFPKDRQEKAILEYGQKQKGDFEASNSRHRYQSIRHHAQRVADYLGWKQVCSICKYDKYVELSHIKAIKDFSDDTKLNEINDPSNLVYLCPNHHKELDLGLITYSK